LDPAIRLLDPAAAQLAEDAQTGDVSIDSIRIAETGTYQLRVWAGGPSAGVAAADAASQSPQAPAATNLGQYDLSIEIEDAPASAVTSLISVDPVGIVADGSSTATVTVHARDGNDAPLSVGGEVVEISSSVGTIGSVTDNGDGTYSATLTSSITAQSGIATATMNGVPIADSTVVEFTPGAADPAASTIDANVNEIPGDGSSTVTITVQLTDANGNNLTLGGDVVVLATTAGTLSAVTDNGDGTYTATLTAPTASGQATITGTLNDVAMTSQELVTFTAGTPDAVASTITADPTSILADGSSTSTITVQLKDVNGNNLTNGGHTVVLSATLTPLETGVDTALSLSAIVDNDDGTYTATLTSHPQTGSVRITGTLEGNAITSETTVTFTVGTADPTTSTITASPTSIEADGSSTSTITVQLKDANGNDLAAGGDAVLLATSAGSLSSVTNNGDGTYTATLTSTTSAATATITGTLNGTAMTGNAVVGIVAGAASPDNSEITVAPSYIQADGSTTTTVTVQLRDSNGNDLAVGGDSVVLATTAGSLGPVVDYGDGTHIAILTSAATPGTAVITGEVNSSPILDSAFVTLISGTGTGLSWTNTAGGSWTEIGNWSTGALPLATDEAFIDVPGTYTVTLQQADAEVTALTLGASQTVSLPSSTDTLTVSGAATVAGTVDLWNGTLVAGGAFSHADNAVIRGVGTIDLTGATVSAFDGNVNPGPAPFTFKGDYAPSAQSALNIELDGSNTQLAVSGAATLAGTLNVTLADGYAPTPGDQFTLVTFTGRSGTTFDTETMPTVPGVLLQLTYSDTDLVLSAISADLAATVTIDPVGASISGVGTSMQLTPYAMNAAGDTLVGKTFTWTSVNPDIATVSATGLVTAQREGQVAIRTEVDGVFGYALMTVGSLGSVPVNVWSAYPRPTPQHLWGVWGSGDSDIWAGGFGGEMYNYDGSSWNPVSTPSEQIVWDYWGTGPDNVWAVGDGGLILQWDGSQWNDMSVATSDFAGVWGSAPNDIWALGNPWTGTENPIFHFDGNSWEGVSNPGGTLRGVWGFAHADVWASGSSVLRYDGSWSVLDPQLAAQAMWGTASNNVWSCQGGWISHFDGNGWTAHTNLEAGGDTFGCSAIWGSGPDDAYATGGPGAVARYDGNVWTIVARTTDAATLQDIWGTASGDVWAVGDSGTVLRGHRGATVTVSPVTNSLTAVGQMVHLAAVAQDAGANPISNVTFTWESDNEGIAVVDADGIVTAQGVGTATITATASGGASGNAAVNVVLAGSVEVTPTSTDVEVGLGVQLTAVVRDGNGDEIVGAPIEWSSDNESSAYVSADGLVMGTSTGSGNVTATSGAESATAAINVIDGQVLPADLVFGGEWEGNAEIYVRSADGVSIRNATTDPSLDVLPTWSPDGSRIAFLTDRDGDREVYSMDNSGWPVNNLTNAPSSDESCPAWSRNASRIAFRSDRNANPDMYFMNNDGSNVTQVTDDAGFECFMSWAPDESWLVFRSNVDGDDEIFRINWDGTGLVQLTNDAFENDAPQLSPDGSQIVFISDRTGQGDVYVMNADGTGVVQLTNDAAADFYPTWSPDGTQITFSSDRYGEYDIFIMNADGTNVVQVTGMAGLERYGALRPSSVLSATSIEVNPADGIITAIGHTLQLNATARNAFGETIESPAINWSSDDELVATVDANGLVTAVAVGAATITADIPGEASGTASVTIVVAASIELTPSTADTIVGFAYQFTAIARDGNGDEIAGAPVEWGNDNPTVIPMSLDGNASGLGIGSATITATSGDQSANATINVTAAPVLPYAVSFTSPLSGDWDVWLRSADGTTVTNLTNYPDATDVFSSWTVDGSRLSFETDRDGNDEIYLMNADGSGQVNLTNHPSSDICTAISRDGTKVAFASDRNGNWDLYVMDNDGGNVLQLTDDAGTHCFISWSPDDSQIIYRGNETGVNEIYSIDADGSNLTQLTFDGPNSQPYMSPDGTRIAYGKLVDDNWDIHTMDPDGTNVVRLTTDPARDQLPNWSPDGSQIAFQSDRGPGWNLYSMNSDGTNLVGLTELDRSEYYVAWQPSGSLPAVAAEVTPEGATITTLGGTQQFSAIVVDAFGTDLTTGGVTWTSLNPAVATVSAGGLATAVANGQVIIQADVDGFTGYAVLTVAAQETDPVNLWMPMTSNTTRNLVDVWGSQANDVYVAGDVGTIMSYDGSTWAEQHSSTGWVLSLWGASPDDIFAVGQDGPVLRGAGAVWSTMESNTTEYLNDVWGASPSDVYAVGGNGTIMHYDGNGWRQVISNTTEELRGVWGASKSDVYAAGTNGTILHYDGNHWSPIESGTTENFRDVWGTSGSNVFVVGNSGTASHFDGAVWNNLNSGGRMMMGVWGSGPTDVYTTTYDSVIRHWDSITWNAIRVPVHRTEGIWSTSGQESVYAVGDTGVILQGYRGATITATPEADTIPVIGNTAQLTVEVRDAGATLIPGVELTWWSRDTTVATVDETGLVTAVRPGRTSIIVEPTYGEARDSTIISVGDDG